MALTPDDVVTKSFQHVRFKDGFDPDEVDDFLDDICDEMEARENETNALKAQPTAGEGAIKSLKSVERSFAATRCINYQSKT